MAPDPPFRTVRWRLFFLISILLEISLAQVPENEPIAALNSIARRVTRRKVIGPRATPLPPPLSFTPDQNWDGVDGQWSSFTVAIGTPAQYVRVFASTASQQIWAVDPVGCPITRSVQPQSMINDTNPRLNKDCILPRGGLFNSSASSTYQFQGNYSLWIERNLGYNGGAGYGYDTVTLGMPGDNGPSNDGMVIGRFGTYDFYLGIFGLNPKPTNFTSFNDGSPSWISSMFAQKRIPSISFGYNAGNQYRFTGRFASLTIGGYDTSRFFPSNVSFTFGPDNERDLLVSVNSITTTASSGNLLSSPIFSYVDSTVPQIWLPIDACQQFEQIFGLQYNEQTDLYFINDTQRQKNLDTNANITFTVAQLPTSQRSVQIVLPYAAFDHTANAPYRGITQSLRYFPLRRAHNDTQYTLGRAFLQEAYLIVDWERRNFSINPPRWIFNSPQNLVAVVSPTLSSGTNGTSGAGTSSSSNGKSGISTGAIAGIAVGAAAVLLGAAIALFIWRRKKRAQRKEAEPEEKDILGSASETSTTPAPAEAGTGGTSVIPKAELDATPVVRDEKGNIIDADENGSLNKPPGTPSSPTAIVESDAREREIFEMPGDMPVMQEADSKQLSEKQAMMRREQIYNGVDPTPSPGLTPVTTSNPSISPTSLVPPRRIQPNEVMEVSPTSAFGTNHFGGDSSPSTSTGLVSPLTMGPTTPRFETRDQNRKRFSYEDDYDE